MNWPGPILTDSGGFQVWSLAERRKITEKGVTFASPVDGSKVFMGPEESMAVQKSVREATAQSVEALVAQMLMCRTRSRHEQGTVRRRHGGFRI